MSFSRICLRPGLTLLEALVALILVSLGGIHAMAAVGVARDAEARAIATLEAAVLADHLATQVRLGLINVEEATGIGVPPQPFAPPFGDYRWSIRPDTNSVWTIDVLRIAVSSTRASVETVVAVPQP